MSTLSDYYAAKGETLPSFAERAKSYEAAGLGSASNYRGTAAQNNALLAKLKNAGNPSQRIPKPQAASPVKPSWLVAQWEKIKALFSSKDISSPSQPCPNCKAPKAPNEIPNLPFSPNPTVSGPEILDCSLGILSAREEVFGGSKTKSKGQMAVVISKGGNDPGGVSYGAWQLSSNAGTLDKYLESKNNPYAARLRDAKAIGKLDVEWKKIAEEDGDAFYDSQRAFIEDTHYRRAQKHAQSRGVDVTQPGIREAIFSGSVQHGGINTIIDNWVADPAFTTADSEERIKLFYDHRTKYVNGLSKVPPDWKEKITTVRYPRELKAALEIQRQCKISTLPEEQTPGRDQLPPHLRRQETPKRDENAVTLAQDKLAKDPHMTSMWRQVDAPIKTTQDKRSASSYADLIDQFDVGNSHAGRYRPDDTYTDTRCNIFAGDVLRAMGVPLPTKGELRGVKDPMTANAKDSYNWLNSDKGREAGWKEIDPSTSEGLAALKEHVNKGAPAVASDPGHISVVRPGQTTDKLKDLSIAQAGASNFNEGPISKTGFGGANFKPKFFIHD